MNNPLTYKISKMRLRMMAVVLIVNIAVHDISAEGTCNKDGDEASCKSDAHTEEDTGMLQWLRYGVKPLTNFAGNIRNYMAGYIIDHIGIRKDDSCNSDTRSVVDTCTTQWLQDSVKQLNNFAETLGQQSLLVGLEKEVYAWKSKHLDIAVVGQTGKGKSSLINAILGLNPYQKGAAKVGAIETTSECAPYPHPRDKTVIMWDCPGAGTENFPLKSYLKTIEVERYDFFLICTSERFHENDIWLGKELEKRKKHFYWMRTKIDQDIRNTKRESMNEITFNENIVLDEVRKDTMHRLNANFKSNELRLFLVSSFYPYKYDFPLFQEQLIKDSLLEKKEKMMLTVQALSIKIIEAKYKGLRSRIWKISAMAALGSLVPIPGVPAAIDVGLIAQEMTYYRQQFDLDDESLNKLAEKMGQSRDQLVNNASLQTIVLLLSAAGVTALAAKYFPGYVFKTAVSGLLIGNAVLSLYSYYSTQVLLDQILSMMKSDAINLNKYIIRHPSFFSLE